MAAAVSINATTDLDLRHDAIYFRNLEKAVQDHYVAPETIAESVWRNFYWRMRLGDFDPSDVGIRCVDAILELTHGTAYVVILDGQLPVYWSGSFEHEGQPGTKLAVC